MKPQPRKAMRRGAGIHRNDITRAMSDTCLTRLATALLLLAALVVVPARAAAQDVCAERGDHSTSARHDRPRSQVDPVEGIGVAAVVRRPRSPCSSRPSTKRCTFSASCSTFLKTTFESWARPMGQEWLLASGALATYVTGRATANPRLTAVGGDLMEAQLLAGAVTLGMKYAVNRQRPDGEARSFPSGSCRRHLRGGVRGATPLRMEGRRARLYRRGIDFRREAASQLPLFNRRHRRSRCGILAGRAATFDIAGARVSASPVIVPGGGAVSFSDDRIRVGSSRQRGSAWPRTTSKAHYQQSAFVEEICVFRTTRSRRSQHGAYPEEEDRQCWRPPAIRNGRSCDWLAVEQHVVSYDVWFEPLPRAPTGEMMRHEVERIVRERQRAAEPDVPVCNGGSSVARRAACAAAESR